jgi:putative transposase
MARRHRVFVEGLSLHVHQRGNNRQDMFHDEIDRMVLLTTLVESSEQFGVDVHVWMFMNNHLHLVVTPENPDGVARLMQQVGRRYVPYFNKRYQRTGGLWEGRYSAHLIDTESYWYRCLRYVELNRVRAGIVPAPQDYAWCSYHSHAFGTADPLVAPHPLYEALGRTPEERQHAHRALCATPLTECELTSIRTALRTGKRPVEPPTFTSIVPA